MDLSSAFAEPFLLYFPSHEALNNTIKLTALSFKIAQPIVEDDFTANGNNGGLLKQPVEPWGFLWADDVADLYERTSITLAGVSLIQIFSAFEQFLVKTRGEIDRWRSFHSQASLSGSSTDDVGNISLQRVFSLLGWDPAPVNQYLPMFDLFQECRNCIAHREGLANRRVCEIASGDAIKHSNEHWPFSTENPHLPDWPLFELGSPISLAPKNIILASTVCYKIAKYLDKCTVAYLGQTGMTYMALYYALLCEDHLFRPQFSKTHQNAVGFYLRNRYKVRNISLESVNSAIGLLELHPTAHSRHRELYPSAH